MGKFDTISVLTLTSVDALRSCASKWDDLWRRSDATQPTARAELVAQWVETFGAGCPFHAIVLCDGDRFVAALPLITRRKCSLIECMDIPGNEWSSGGELLLDPACDVNSVCDRLVVELTGLPGALCWFDSIAVDSPAWQRLVGAAELVGLDVDIHRQRETGRIDVSSNDPFPSPRWSKSFRKQMRRAIRELRDQGALGLRLERPENARDACRLLMDGLRIEDAGWKGRAGTSILSHREIRSFYESQACQLAKWGQVRFAFLDLDQRPIAFEYAWWAKEIHHSMKIAYDERFARQSPGQVLVYQLLERFHETGECRAIDVIGPLDAAARRWRPRPRSVGRLLLAPHGLLGKAVIFASRNVLPQVRKWRRTMTASAD